MIQLNLKTIEAACDDVYKIRLSADEPLHYKAGQYLLVNMGDDDMRPFSIASCPAKDRFIELHIGATPENPYAWDIIERLRTIGNIQVQLGVGEAYLQNSSQHAVLVAGGTGYAYVKSILGELVATQSSRQISVFWGAKLIDSIYEADFIEQLASKHSHINFYPVVESPTEQWTGLTGLVTDAVITVLQTQLPECEVYIAGPFAMAKSARTLYFQHHLPRAQLFGDAYAFI